MNIDGGFCGLRNPYLPKESNTTFSYYLRATRWIKKTLTSVNLMCDTLLVKIPFICVLMRHWHASVTSITLVTTNRQAQLRCVEYAGLAEWPVQEIWHSILSLGFTNIILVTQNMAGGARCSCMAPGSSAGNKLHLFSPGHVDLFSFTHIILAEANR